MQEIVHRLCRYQEYNPRDIISLICQACKNVIRSAAYLQPLVFWSVISSEGCAEILCMRKILSLIDLPCCIGACGNLPSRLQIDRTFKLCLTAQQRPIPRRLKPAGICVWNVSHTVKLSTAFLMTWNALALTDQTFNPFLSSQFRRSLHQSPLDHQPLQRKLTAASIKTQMEWMCILIRANQGRQLLTLPSEAPARINNGRTYDTTPTQTHPQHDATKPLRGQHAAALISSGSLK